MAGYFGGLLVAAALTLAVVFVFSLGNVEAFVVGVILGVVCPTVGAVLDG